MMMWEGAAGSVSPPDFPVTRHGPVPPAAEIEMSLNSTIRLLMPTIAMHWPMPSTLKPRKVMKLRCGCAPLPKLLLLIAAPDAELTWKREAPLYATHDGEELLVL